MCWRCTVLTTARMGSRASAILSLSIKGCDPLDAEKALDQAFSVAVRGGLHCSPYAHRWLGTFPQGALRLSPGYFNTVEEANRVLAALREAAG